MSMICFSFTKRLLLHVINRIKLTQIKNTLWGKNKLYIIVPGKYIHVRPWLTTHLRFRSREKGTIYNLLEKLYPYPLQTL